MKNQHAHDDIERVIIQIRNADRLSHQLINPQRIVENAMVLVKANDETYRLEQQVEGRITYFVRHMQANMMLPTDENEEGNLRRRAISALTDLQTHFQLLEPSERAKILSID